MKMSEKLKVWKDVEMQLKVKVKVQKWLMIDDQDEEKDRQQPTNKFTKADTDTMNTMMKTVDDHYLID
jgi:hypothetical protein